jgi:hypothetical protein
LFVPEEVLKEEYIVAGLAVYPATARRVFDLLASAAMETFRWVNTAIGRLSSWAYLRGKVNRSNCPFSTSHLKSSPGANISSLPVESTWVD